MSESVPNDDGMVYPQEDQAFSEARDQFVADMEASMSRILAAARAEETAEFTWEDGPAVKAIREGKTLIFDEIDPLTQEERDFLDEYYS